MPNASTGRDTSTKSYFQFLGATFNHQIRNGVTSTASGTHREQNVLELTRDENNRLIPRNEQNPAVSSLQLYPPVTSILRTEQHQSVTSARVRFTSSNLDTTIPIADKVPLMCTTINQATRMMSAPYRTTNITATPIYTIYNIFYTNYEF